MYHYVYCVENLVNGKVYVGKHSTNDIDDGYMGSGKLLKAAIKKHGVENFQKHILAEFASSEEALAFEHQLVNETFVEDSNTYNLTIGGKGAWANVNNNEQFRKEKNRKAAIMMNKICWQDPQFRQRRITSLLEMTKRLRKEGKLRAPNWTGRRHSESTKKKIGTANAAAQRGSRNSQFGTVWISNVEEKMSKKVKKDELELFLEKGWILGRKMKW